MKKAFIIFWAVAAFSWIPQRAHGEVIWRVSVKFITDGKNKRPTNGTITNDAAVQAQIDFANTLPSLAGRGIRLDLVEILDVTGASSWFDRDPDGQARTELEANATADPGKFHWRTDAINIYMNNMSAGGCSFPGNGSIIFLGSSNKEWVFIHEIGHYMSLEHTQAGEKFLNTDGSNCDEKDQCADCAQLVPGDDHKSDTLPDHSCWDTQNQIAQGNFGKDWADLSSADQARVDNTRYNIMSYHGSRSLFTTLQLDAMCDTSNIERDSASHNDFIFVDVAAVGLAATGLSKIQAIGGPFKQLKNAIDRSNGGDVLLIRPGEYTEERVISKAITLRGVRRDVLTPGNAILRAR